MGVGCHYQTISTQRRIGDAPRVSVFGSRAIEHRQKFRGGWGR
jgi:hypothetical protein